MHHKDWIPFDRDGGLPDHLDTQSAEKLLALFDGTNQTAGWVRAIHSIGLTVPRTYQQIFRLDEDGQPQIYWPYVVNLVSGGVIQYQQKAYQVSYTPQAIWRLIVVQWQVSRFILKTLKSPLPDTDDACIIESLALGICLLALMLRVRDEDEASLAQSLADIPRARKSLQPILRQMQDIQLRRTQLSSAWQRMFPHTATDDISPPIHHDLTYNSAPIWQGIGVCGREVSGRVVVLDRVKDFHELAASQDPLVLVFARARPETVELFPNATAVLYGDGGVMSHACTVARESDLPVITALGQDFVQALRGKTYLWVKVDPQTGRVQIIENHS